jgi:RNA polymerase primary sigma factor
MTAAVLDKENTPVSTGEDDVRQYLQEIRQYPRLTPEQEKELAKRRADGDEDAIKAMVNSNLRLVVSVAREYVGRGAPLLDMIQEGSIGLLAAARKFDHTLDYRFSTYATKWIRQGVSRCVMEHAGLIRVPRHTAERIKKLLRAKRELQKLEGCEPSLEQIAQYSGIPADKAEELLRLMPEVCSLDAPAGEDDGTLQLLLENMHSPQPYEELVRQEMKRLLESLLGLLPERQQQVLRLRFGMEDGQCHTLEQIGAYLGVSKERARQIEHQAVEKLQKLGAGLGLEEFLE